MISCVRPIRTNAELAMRYVILEHRDNGAYSLPNFPVTNMAIAEPLKEYGLTSLPYRTLRPHAERAYPGIDFNTAALTNFFQLTHACPVVETINHEAGQARLIFPVPDGKTYQCIDMKIALMQKVIAEQLADFGNQAGTENMPGRMAHDIARKNDLLHTRSLSLIGLPHQPPATSGERLVFNN